MKIADIAQDVAEVTVDRIVIVHMREQMDLEVIPMVQEGVQAAQTEWYGFYISSLCLLVMVSMNCSEQSC